MSSSSVPLPAPVFYPRPWLVVLTVNFGTIAALASSIGLINLIMPRMMAELGADIRSIQWVQTSFLMTQAVLMPAVGWAGTALGQKRLYVGSLSLFAAGTLLCTLAWDLPSMILFRVVQSIGASFFFPMGVPFIFDAFPPQRRGSVLGVSALIGTMGSLGGSMFASHLADVFGWRWGFYYLIPLCAAGLAMSAVVLRAPRGKGAARFDVAGCAALAAALISLVLLITRRDSQPAVSGSNAILLLICLTATAAFFIVERRSAAPFVDLSIYRHAAYAAGSFLGFLLPATAVAISFLLPIYLQGLLGYSILQTAMLRLPMTFALAFVTPFSGWLSDRMDTRILAGAGAVGYLLSLVGFAQLSMYTSWTTLAGLLTLMGVSATVLFLPMTNVMYSALPHDAVRLASGLHALMRQLGRSVGTAAISAIFAHRFVLRFTETTNAVWQDTPAVRLHLSRISDHLRDVGVQHPDPFALGVIHQRLSAEASVAAFGDCFLFMAAAFLVALFPVYYLRADRA